MMPQMNRNGGSLRLSALVAAVLFISHYNALAAATDGSHDQASSAILGDHHLKAAGHRGGIAAAGRAEALNVAVESADIIQSAEAATTGRGRSRRLLQSGCSTTDNSAAAILACTNAVRVNPDIMSGAPCFSSSLRSWLKSPQRNALNSISALNTAAVNHNNRMVNARQMSHQLSGEAALGDRVRASGYSWSRVSENIAWNQDSAYAVVAAWLCSTTGHRENMFSCDVRDIGVASASRYYTQVFGCPSGQTCNSCGSSNIVTTNCPAVNGFTASANTDFNGNDIRQAGTTTATAAAACAANPWCRGFNSNGWIKHSLPSQSTVQGLCFYRRNVQPGGPAHGMTVSIGTGTNRQGCIDVPWNNKAAGVVLHQWECNGGSAQRWYLEHAGNGWYRVKATSSLCMGVRESRTTSGTDVLLWGCSNINDQLFAFVWNSARGAYTMRPAHASSMCVDISSSSTANGARVQIWTCNDSAAQMFSLAP